MRIIIIDDLPDSVDHFLDELESKGVDYIFYETIAEAIAGFKSLELPVDGVILDMQMPGAEATWDELGGLEIFSRIELLSDKWSVDFPGRVPPVGVLSQLSKKDFVSKLVEIQDSKCLGCPVRPWSKFDDEGTFVTDYLIWIKEMRGDPSLGGKILSSTKAALKAFSDRWSSLE